MKKGMAFLTVALILLCAAKVLTADDYSFNPQQQLVMENISLNPLAFTENQGQWDEQVKFKANAGGATMWFTSEGVVYQFIKQIKSPDLPQDELFQLPYEQFEQEPDSIEQLVVKTSFIGANLNPAISGEDLMEYKCNYFIGNDHNEWHTDVTNYQAVYFKEIYSGIDLKYYGNGKQMEYDFIVSPGSNYSQIQIQYEGVKSLSVNSSSELVVETEWGNVIEKKPIIYQMDGNDRLMIEGEYNITDINKFSFILDDNYNPNLELVIDPVLEYSTYLGGDDHDSGSDIVVDASGVAYITGGTFSTDFPTLNPYQGTFQGSHDAFVTKLSSSGNSLVYSTYLGGGGSDNGYDIAVDASGMAYITGYTESTDFPTLNPYQVTNQGGRDAFVTKLNSSGNSLVYSTYIGGSGVESGFGIAVDASGMAYITGYTSSTDFPTLNPYQGTYQGFSDAFVTKLSSSGNSLVYSTYLGGSVHSENGRGIAVDASGMAYITGFTESTDFPTLNPYQGTYQGGGADAFVTKLSS